MNSNRNNGTLVAGIIVLAIGTLFLARNLGLINIDIARYLFNYYSWMLYVGAILLFSRESKILGGIFLGLGITFLLSDMGYIPNISIRVLWPLIVIGVGTNLLYKALRGRVPDGEPIEANSLDFINDTHIFGGGEFTISSQNFKGGKVTSIFGGGNYILESAKLSPNTKNVLEVNNIFGGCNLIVPKDWTVKVESTNILGGFSDNRKGYPTTDNPEKTLFITGLSMFGGGEVKSY